MRRPCYGSREARRKGRRVSRLRQTLAVILFFAAAAVLYTYPLVLDLRHAIMRVGGDYMTEAALVGWNAQLLLDEPLRLFDRQFVFKSQFFYPHSNSHAYLQTMLFPGMVGVPLFAWTRDALLTTNLLLLLVLTASGVAMWAVTRDLTGGTVPGLVAGVVFTLLPYRMDHLGQFTTQWGFCLPVVFWAQYRFLHERRFVYIALVALGLWAQALSTMYYAYAGGLLLVAFTVAFLLLRPSAVTWGLVAKAAAGTALLALLLVPFLAPYVAVHQALGFQRGADWWVQVASMDLLAFLDAGIFNRSYGKRLLRTAGVENGLFLGFIPMALCVLAIGWLVLRDAADSAAPAWRRRARLSVVLGALVCIAALTVVALAAVARGRVASATWLGLRDLSWAILALPLLALAYVALERPAARGEPLTQREWVAVLAFLAVFTYLLTTGPQLTIAGQPHGRGFYHWLYHYVPGGRAFGAPGRWGLVFVLCVALLAAFGARLVQARLRGRAGPFVAALLVALPMAEYVCFPLRWERLAEPPAVYRWLAAEPGDFAILELPVQDGGAEAWFTYWVTVHLKRTVNGQLSFIGPTLTDFAQLTEPLQLPAFVERLRSIYPMRYLLAHRGFMTGPGDEFRAQREAWTRLRTATVPGLALVRSFDDTDVYLVAPTPETGLDLHRYFSSDLVRRRPDAAYSVRFVGHDPEVQRWIEVSFNGRTLAHLEADTTEVRRLAHPYRAGDQNEVRFVHRYVVRPEVSRDAGYQIGRTGVHSRVDLYVESGGKFSGNTASIRVGNVEVLRVPRRGYHIVAVDPADGQILAVGEFDTFRSVAESVRLVRMIEGLPRGTIVAAAVKHDGGGQLTAEAVRALNAVGGRHDLTGTLWRTHVLIGVKGARPGEAEEASGDHHLVATIGRSRELTFALEEFSLR
jgi:hypothetical protein